MIGGPAFGSGPKGGDAGATVPGARGSGGFNDGSGTSKRVCGEVGVVAAAGDSGVGGRSGCGGGGG